VGLHLFPLIGAVVAVLAWLLVHETSSMQTVVALRRCRASTSSLSAR
jgi:hypothetical protein